MTSMTNPDALVEELATVVHGALSKANIMAYLDMPLETAGDVARTILPIIETQLAAAKADAERLDFLDKHPGVELSYAGWDECEWQVHLVTGGRNDREWNLLGSGQTTREAIDAAIAAWEKSRG